MGLRAVLQSPFVYQTFQRMVGGIHMREECLRILDPQAGHRVLDVGCGPAYYLAQMPEVEYHGFDTDEVYIAHARRKFGERGQFYCEVFDAQAAERLGKFDRIMLMGLLHHLDDEACDELLGLLSRSLRPGGVLVALDTVVHSKQNFVERALAEGDRGEFVRTPEEFVELARPYFPSVDGHLASQFWVPSIYWVMVMQVPSEESA